MENKRHIAIYNFLGKPSLLCNISNYYNTIPLLIFEEMYKEMTPDCFEIYLRIINICKNCLRIYLKNEEKKHL